jgi:hypothetical protein
MARIVSRAPAAMPHVPMATVTWAVPAVALALRFSIASSFSFFSSSSDLTAGMYTSCDFGLCAICVRLLSHVRRLGRHQNPKSAI